MVSTIKEHIVKTKKLCKALVREILSSGVNITAERRCPQAEDRRMV